MVIIVSWEGAMATELIYGAQGWEKSNGHSLKHKEQSDPKPALFSSRDG